MDKVQRETECDACGEFADCFREDDENIFWICDKCLKKGDE